MASAMEYLLEDAWLFRLPTRLYQSKIMTNYQLFKLRGFVFHVVLCDRSKLVRSEQLFADAFRLCPNKYNIVRYGVIKFTLLFCCIYHCMSFDE